MKIAVFENEYNSVKGAFEAANLIYFDEKLTIDVFPSSQNFNFNNINDYDLYFIDISLSSKSNLDGFGVIKEFKTINDNLANKIIILTGNSKIQEIMKSDNTYDSRYEFIIKPTNYKIIGEMLKEKFAQR
jgi:DNA-binding LytR/AlgR family response regulator